MYAVILAGGKGRRLHPYTICFPKSLVPVGEMPILEIVLRQLRAAGCRRATMAVGHLAELLMAYFGDGERVDMELVYSREDKPLGTAGPLTLIDDLPENFLVMNGDILTTLKYRALFDYHIANDADLTIACNRCNAKIDLGVVEFDGSFRVTGYREKPSLPYDVSMGVYIFSRRVLELIQPGQYLDFPNLVHMLIAAGRKVKVFMSDALWLDIGRAEDLARSMDVFAQNRDLFLPDDEHGSTGLPSDELSVGASSTVGTRS